MTSQWVNKHDIKRDLVIAQGRIPVDITNAVTARAKPPDLIIYEENEIEHFGNCCEDVEFQSGPDLGLIQEMLNMVKQTSECPDIVPYDTGHIVEINKISSECEHAHVNITTNVHNGNIIVLKKKRQRNVAIASLLETYSKESSIQSKCDESETMFNDHHMKLLKPEHFITKNENGKTIAVVNKLINSESARIMELSISFKKKSPDTLMNDIYEENMNASSKSFSTYKPSSMADLYYKRYLERTKLKESMQNEFHSKTEKMMEKIDAKEFDIVRLQQHRHQLREDCIVCSTFFKKYIT